MQSVEATSYRARVEAMQSSLMNELQSRHFTVTGSNSLLVNAVFVKASPDQVDELKALPGVSGVVQLRKYKRNLNQATQLLNSAAAWNLLGGMPNAGKGIKIGIIDTGIDQNHPSMQDNGLTVPTGFPKCDTPSNCSNFTNSKVIVARSYVRRLALGTGAINPATSHPDDYSARDRVGHGTAVATAAAGNASTTGGLTITGMAPKAWVGSYKVFGSPGVNDNSTDDVLIAALSDAVADGMDMVSMSIGGVAFTGPLDTGAACGQGAGVPCDLTAAAFEDAAKAGTLIIVAAGNEGSNGLGGAPTYNSVSSPANAPSVIAVGGITNSHGFLPGIRVTGDVPANLNLIAAQPSDSSDPSYGAHAAPLLDVASLGDDGYACSALPPGSLNGSFALVQRSPAGAGCTFSAKMTNAVNAGATGVIFYDYTGSTDYPVSPGNLFDFSQPAVAISNSDGVNLKAFIDATPRYEVTIDPAAVETPLTQTNQLVFYSSAGPAMGTNALKPDILAVAGGGSKGDLILMGAQSFDPLGDLYSSTGYVASAGTSFATPLTTGAAALVKQNHPKYTAAQIKSALLNTAGQEVVTDDAGQPTDILETGAGKVAADRAVQTNVTVVPATLSYGALATGALPRSIPFVVTNTGSTALNLTLAVVASGPGGGAQLAVDKPTVSLAAGASATVMGTLSGTVPAAGIYSGAITIAGSAVPLRVPYLFLVGSTVATNFLPISGDANDVSVGQVFPDQVIAFRVTDGSGVPVSGAAVNFSVNSGSAPVTLTNISTTTNVYGIATATARAGQTAGAYTIEGCLGTCTRFNQLEYTYTGTVRNAPAITPGGIVSSANTTASAPIVPGSYFSIYGAGLSDKTDVTSTAALPMAIAKVNVSFDVPSAGISVPARLVFVSAGQINAQVPWEMQGQSSAQVKVIVNGNTSNVLPVQIAAYAPAFFDNPIGSGVVAAIDPLNTANPVITASNPAKRGSTVALYANSLGPVSSQPASGDVASATALARTTTVPTVSIGGQAAQVSYSGLTPGLPGLYQINVTVPGNIAAGSQPVSLTIGGVTAKPVSITVQ
ncbi:MAG: minor extracellular serine protease Vpr [Bryobacterales bacterium]|nr:minor extracellular serine protease Vpr [Bryobacterales bacterium]